MEQVYLITPGEYEGLDIVKIGMHRGNTTSRINSYGRKTKIYSIRSVSNSKFIEKEIMKQFKLNFKIYKGREYFEGEIDKCIDLFDKIVDKLSYDNFIKKCEIEPIYYKFHCKTYCHKKCYFKELININKFENSNFIRCVNCNIEWKKRKVFYAKKINKINKCVGYEGNDKKHDIEYIINIMESEILVKGIDYNYNSNLFFSEIELNGYNISKLLNEKVFNIDENEHYLPNAEYEYPMIFYTHILYGPFRIGDINGQHGMIEMNKDKNILLNDIYIKSIKETDFLILLIDKKMTCFGSLFEAGMGLSLEKKILIIFDDELIFPQDLNIIKNNSINYKEFWYIYQYNYILKKEEDDILLMFPIIRDKFLTYEDYIDAQKEYKKMMECDKENSDDESIFNLSIKNNFYT